VGVNCAILRLPYLDDFRVYLRVEKLHNAASNGRQNWRDFWNKRRDTFDCPRSEATDVAQPC
jgi:hypothetical protein